MAEADEDVRLEGGTSDSTPSGNDGVPWIKTAAALLGLVGALVGIMVSVVGLVQKAKTDNETAKINREIAQQQLDTRKQEDQDQKTQHDQDQRALQAARIEGEQIKKEERLQGLIGDIFSATQGAEGKIDLLSTFIQDDHRYDSIIANAIRVRLEDPHSASEVSLAFSIFQKLNIPKVPFLIAANERARRRFDDAVADRFWVALYERLQNAGFPYQDRSKIAGGMYANVDLHSISPGHALFNLVSDTETATVSEISIKEDFPDSDYLYATINRFVASSYLSDIDPGEERKHSPDKDSFWARDISDRMRHLLIFNSTSGAVSVLRPELDARLGLELEILRRTSAMLPNALQEKRQSPDQGEVSLSGCYLLGPNIWSRGKYTKIDFKQTLLYEQNTSGAIFDRPTMQSVQMRQIVIKESRFDAWAMGSYQSSPMNLQFSSPVTSAKP